ncbi:MAG: S41 family peptidase, partial [Gemmatimonadales bacterium]
MPIRLPPPSSASPNFSSRVGRALALAALLAAPSRTPLLEAQGAAYEQLQTFSGLLNQVRLNYVDSVTYAQLVRAAIDGVLGSLDPHSYFLSREDGERRLEYEAGQLAGTGIILDEVDAATAVQAVLPGSPGAKAGVQPGDRLVSLNDTSIAGLSLQRLESRMIGEKGSKLRMLFERGSRNEPDSFKVTIKNDLIQPRSVGIVRMVDQTTGYLRLTGFHADASK